MDYNESGAMRAFFFNLPPVLSLRRRLVAHAREPPLHDLHLRLLGVVQQRPDLVLTPVRRAGLRPGFSRELLPEFVPKREARGARGRAGDAIRRPREASARNASRFSREPSAPPPARPPRRRRGRTRTRPRRPAREESNPGVRDGGRRRSRARIRTGRRSPRARTRPCRRPPRTAATGADRSRRGFGFGRGDRPVRRGRARFLRPGRRRRGRRGAALAAAEAAGVLGLGQGRGERDLRGRRRGRASSPRGLRGPSPSRSRSRGEVRGGPSHPCACPPRGREGPRTCRRGRRRRRPGRAAAKFKGARARGGGAGAGRGAGGRPAPRTSRARAEARGRVIARAVAVGAVPLEPEHRGGATKSGERGTRSARSGDLAGIGARSESCWPVPRGGLVLPRNSGRALWPRSRSVGSRAAPHFDARWTRASRPSARLATGTRDPRPVAPSGSPPLAPRVPPPPAAVSQRPCRSEPRLRARSSRDAAPRAGGTFDANALEASAATACGSRSRTPATTPRGDVPPLNRHPRRRDDRSRRRRRVARAVPAAAVFPANPEVLEGAEDLTQLSYLNEPSVLHDLRHRYHPDRDDITPAPAPCSSP